MESQYDNLHVIIPSRAIWMSANIGFKMIIVYETARVEHLGRW